MLRGALLWLLGVPIPVIIVVVLTVVQFRFVERKVTY